MIEPIDLARIQFAANITFHILFPTINLALAWILVFFQQRYNKTADKNLLENIFNSINVDKPKSFLRIKTKNNTNSQPVIVTVKDNEAVTECLVQFNKLKKETNDDILEIFYPLI